MIAATRRMNHIMLAVHADADESFDLPRGFAAEMKRKCNAFMDKRGLTSKADYFGNFRVEVKKEGGK